MIQAQKSVGNSWRFSHWFSRKRETVHNQNKLRVEVCLQNRMGTGKENLNRTEIPIVPFQSLKKNFRKLSESTPMSPLCPQSFAIKIDRHAGNFGRHFNVWLLRESVGTDVLLFCFLVGQIRRSLVLRVNQITRIYLRIRKLLWPSCSSLWVVTRRITNDERSARSRVLKRTRTSFQTQLKIARYVVTFKWRKASCSRNLAASNISWVFSWYVFVPNVLMVKPDFRFQSSSHSKTQNGMFVFHSDIGRANYDMKVDFFLSICVST